MRGVVAFLNRSTVVNDWRSTCLAKSLLSTQDRKLLVETRHLLEELLETEEVLRDKALMKSTKESQRDVKSGRLYPIGQLKRKLREEDKL